MYLDATGSRNLEGSDFFLQENKGGLLSLGRSEGDWMDRLTNEQMTRGLSLYYKFTNQPLADTGRLLYHLMLLCGFLTLPGTRGT